MAELADIYCSDASAMTHRAHSSMVSEGCSVKCSDHWHADRAPLRHPVRCEGCDEIQLIMNLLARVNIIIVSGGVAFTFIRRPELGLAPPSTTERVQSRCLRSGERQQRRA